METSTYELGASAEDRAAAALEAAGYTIVARNWTCAAGELDIVAHHRGVLVFVEVRSRASPSFGHALEMVSAQKRARVTKIARLYLAFERPLITSCRFDVVAITGHEIVIVPDAWRVRSRW